MGISENLAGIGIEFSYGTVDNLYVFGRGALGLEQRRMSGRGFKDYNHRVGAGLDGFTTLFTTVLSYSAKGIKAGSTMSADEYRAFLKSSENSIRFIRKTARKGMLKLYNLTVEKNARMVKNLDDLDFYSVPVKPGLNAASELLK